MKKLTLVLLVLSLMVGVFASCGKQSAQITVVTREEGSGTRSAFVELIGVMVEKDGEEVDGITKTAVQQKSTSTVRTSALKMISDMERIGDQAADIAEITFFIGNAELKNQIHLHEMASAAVKMVTDSVDSFVKRDLALAQAVIASDDVVDGFFDAIKKELIEVISVGGADGEICIDLLMIAKYLERIADHATNIAEWVEFSITGTHRNTEMS